jgi:hypothetical protein
MADLGELIRLEEVGGGESGKEGDKGTWVLSVGEAVGQRVCPLFDREVALLCGSGTHQKSEVSAMGPCLCLDVRGWKGRETEPGGVEGLPRGS